MCYTLFYKALVASLLYFFSPSVFCYAKSTSPVRWRQGALNARREIFSFIGFTSFGNGKSYIFVHGFKKLDLPLAPSDEGAVSVAD